MRGLTPIAVGLMLAYSAQAADLLDVYQAADQQDPTYAAAKQAYKAGIEKLPQARAALWPQVNLTAPLTGNYVKDHLFARNASYGSASYTLSLTQPLYRLQNNIVVDQATLQLTQFEAQLNQAQQDLILRATQAYFDVLLAEDNVAVSRNQKIAISEQLAQAKRNFEVGTATITDTHEAQARYDLATAREIADQNDLEVKRRALEILIGRPLDDLAPLRDRLVLPPPTPSDMSQWVDVARKQNLQVVVFQAAEQIAEKEISRNKAAFTPTVDLVASYGDSATTTREPGFGQEVSNASVGVQINIPIWEGGLRHSRVREAVANRERARFDTEGTRRKVAQDARQAYLGVTSGIAQVKALEQAVVSTQSQLDSTKLGQEVGVRTGVDVLNAQQQLFSARRDLYSAQYNTILNQLKLKFAAGLLARNDLIEVNGSLRRPGEPATGNARVPRATTPTLPRAIGRPPGELRPADPKEQRPIRRPAPRRPGGAQ
ncbi:MAG: TolC family outer membrane protein [Pseudomonadota bacterium]|nr:TolC family outer membrane protein [Pseudomonadota bacterium]